MDYAQLLNALNNKKIDPVYVLTGSELYLMDQLVQALKTAVVDPSYADFNEVVMEAPKADFTEMINAFETLPFFSEKRLIFVKGCDWLGTQTKGSLSEDDEALLMKYLDNPLESSVVVLMAESVDKRKKLVKTLQKQACFVELTKLEKEPLKKLVLQTLKGFEATVSSEAVEYLLFALGYLEKDSSKDLYQVVHQVELLGAYCKGQVVEKGHIDKLIEKPLDTNIFAFLDAVSDGKTAEAVKIKNQLLADGLNDIQINSMLYKQMRNLYKTTLLLKKGYSPNQVAERLGVHPFSAKKYVAQCRAFKPEYLKGIVIQLAELDYRMKTGRIGFSDALDLMSVCLSKRLPLIQTQP